MPTRAPRACPRCGTAIRARHCTTCYPAWASSQRGSHIDANKWRKVKARRLKANPLCQACTIAIATEVDHVHNLAAGGDPYAYSNTQSLCNACHTAKTSREAATARWTPRRYT